MMSKKCKYALKALIRLGKEYGGGPIFTDDIATSEHIPKKFLELILPERAGRQFSFGFCPAAFIGDRAST